MNEWARCLWWYNICYGYLNTCEECDKAQKFSPPSFSTIDVSKPRFQTKTTPITSRIARATRNIVYGYVFWILFILSLRLISHLFTLFLPPILQSNELLKAFLHMSLFHPANQYITRRYVWFLLPRLSASVPHVMRQAYTLASGSASLHRRRQRPSYSN